MFLGHCIARSRLPPSDGNAIGGRGLTARMANRSRPFSPILVCPVGWLLRVGIPLTCPRAEIGYVRACNSSTCLADNPRLPRVHKN